jgi:hypothetical protein
MVVFSSRSNRQNDDRWTKIHCTISVIHLGSDIPCRSELKVDVHSCLRNCVIIVIFSSISQSNKYKFKGKK